MAGYSLASLAFNSIETRLLLPVCFLFLFSMSPVSWPVENAGEILERGPVSSQSQTAFELREDNQTIGNLSSYIVYVSDEVVSTIEQARKLEFNDWNQLNGNEFNVGYKKEGFWFRAFITVPSTSNLLPEKQNALFDSKRNWILVIHNDYQDLKVYREDATGLTTLYDARNNSAEEVQQDGRNRTVPIEITQGSEFRLYLYVRSMGSNQYPLSLLSREDYLASEITLLSGIYLALGSLCMMILLSLAFGWIFRDISLVYYGLTISMVAVVNAGSKELPEHWLGPISHAFLQNLIFTCIALGLVAFTLFTRLQMISPGNHPFYPKFFKVVAWIVTVCPLASMMILPLHQQRELMLLLFALTAISWLVAGVHNSLLKQRVAMIYICGVSVYLLGAFSQILNRLGIYPDDLLSDNLQTWGLGISMTLLLVSVSSRFSAQTRLTLTAQSKALNYEQSARESQAQLLELERKTTESLERKVASRTLELESAIKALEQAKSEAEEANSQKTRFLAAASHDIRQPLQALSFLSEALIHDCQNRSQASQIKRNEWEEIETELVKAGINIHTSVSNLIQLFDLLFDLSNLDNKQMKPNLMPVDLHQCVHDFSETIRPLCQKEGVELVVEMDEVALFIKTDVVLLHRILHILVDNALKHAGCRQIRLETSVFKKFFFLAVVDDGIGIPKAEQKNIFEEFYQLKKSQSNSREGMGIGLALCKRLVNLLGYQLKLDSAPGIGARFELQMVCLEGVVDIEKLIVQKLEPASQINFSGMKVLVVEDDIAACNAMVTLLEKWGAECRFANHADDSWQYIKNGWIPALAIFDYCLSDYDNGFELAAQLRKFLGYQLPVLIYTGDTDVISPDLSLPVLYKPLRPSVLRTAITNQLLCVT
tara:strand:- start:699 stop:3344 length:2646 start_codon:yes stop_codon:yes gene_type:complete